MIKFKPDFVRCIELSIIESSFRSIRLAYFEKIRTYFLILSNTPFDVSLGI